VPVLVSGRAINSYRCVPVAIDLDRDGSKDLVLGEWYSSVRFYRNTGPDSAPVFTGFINLVEPDPDSFLNGNPPRVNFTDWDGDTDMDMITCDYYGSVFLRRNVTPSGTEEAESGEPGMEEGVPTVVRALPASGDGREASCVFDAAGRPVHDPSRAAPGVYVLRLEAGGFTASRRLVLMR
jgi:hypothetical protein